MTRKPAYDPRTVARDIPGVFDSIFPQLTPGIVAHYNQTAESTECDPVPSELIHGTSLQKAMLFEIGFAVGEKLITGQAVDWDECLRIAVARQVRHFDARIPERITEIDQRVAQIVGENIASMTSQLATERGFPVRLSPSIPGFQWISSGSGDLSAGSTLVEVKCSNRNFSSSDYRQIVMYWLLSFAASVESNSLEWSEGILLNPRSAVYVAVDFNDFLHVISAGRTKVEILQLFSTMVATRNEK